MDLFVLNILIFSLNFKAQLFGIEKLSTSISLGVITMMIIIHSIKNFNPDLIMAIGGGSVIDYAKIANILEINHNLDFQIKYSTYKIKKKKAK